MKLTDVKLDVLTDPNWAAIWREHERKLHEHIVAMHAGINAAMEREAVHQLGYYPTNTQVSEYGVCAIHLDGRREYKWAGKTVAVMHPWEGPLPPRVEFP